MIDMAEKRPHARVFQKLTTIAWGKASGEFVTEFVSPGTSDRKAHLSHSKCLRDSDGSLALGYAMKGHRENGRVVVLAALVETLSAEDISLMKLPDGSPDRDRIETEKKRVRGHLTSRMATLEYFGLVIKDKPNKACVTYAVTDAGIQLEANYDDAFEQLLKDL